MLHSHTFSNFNGASGTAQGGTAHTHHSPVITQLENTHAPAVCALWPSLESTTASSHEYSTPLASTGCKCKGMGLPRWVCATAANNTFGTLLLVFISLHCSSTPRRHWALPTGRHSPIQIIQFIMQNAGMLGRRSLHPHSRAPQLSQAGWDMAFSMEFSSDRGNSSPWGQLQGNSSSSSQGDLDLNPWQSVSYNNLKLQFCNSFLGTERDNNGEIKRGKAAHRSLLHEALRWEKIGVIFSIKFSKCRTNPPVTTINKLVDWTFLLVNNLQYFPQLQNLQRTSARLIWGLIFSLVTKPHWCQLSQQNNPTLHGLGVERCKSARGIE